MPCEALLQTTSSPEILPHPSEEREELLYALFGDKGHSEKRVDTTRPVTLGRRQSRRPRGDRFTVSILVCGKEQTSRRAPCGSETRYSVSHWAMRDGLGFFPIVASRFALLVFERPVSRAPGRLCANQVLKKQKRDAFFSLDTIC